MPARSLLPLSLIGCGARTPLGLTAPLTAAAVRAGICRIAEHPSVMDKMSDPCMVVMDRALEEESRVERLLVFLKSALDEALQGLEVDLDAEVPVFLALPEEGEFFTRDDGVAVARAAQAHLSARCRAQVEPLPQGNAAGFAGLQSASEVLAEKRASIAIVAGVDSQVEERLLLQLDASARLMSSANRFGYPPGEGAGALVVAGPAGLAKLKAQALVSVRGLGLAREQNLIATESICVGQGLAHALREALQSLPGETVSHIYCDLTAERYRSSEYMYAALRLSTQLPRPSDFTAPADCWGDLGAATMPLLVALVVASAQRGYAPGAHPLVWASSESGLRGAAVFDLPAKKLVQR